MRLDPLLRLPFAGLLLLSSLTGRAAAQERWLEVPDGPAAGNLAARCEEPGRAQPR